MPDISMTMALALIGGIAGASVLAGLLAGMLGVGGGIILVPVLYWVMSLLDVPQHFAMHLAVATSLCTIIFTAISSVRAHARRGAIDGELLRRWSPGIVAGALGGSLLARYLDASVLKAIFGVIGLIVAANMATSTTLVLSKGLPVARGMHWAISASIGLLSSLMGIGGGTLSVPTLGLFSYPIHRAVGTSAAFGLAIALPATGGFILSGWSVPDLPPFSVGYVNLAAVAIILPFTTLLAPAGARLTHSLSGLTVKRVFAAFLAVTALRMLADLI